MQAKATDSLKDSFRVKSRVNSVPVLKKQKHEVFAQGIVQNLSPTQAYKNAGYSERNAAFAAKRLCELPAVCARIEELRAVCEQVFVKGNIADRTYRVAVLDEVATRLVQAIKESTSLRREAALLRELREYHKQAAIELGQWSEKQELTVKAEAPKTDWSKVSQETILLARAKMIEARELLTIEAVPGSVETIKPESS